MTHDELSHEELTAGIAEEALGVLDGRARAELLAHAEGCPTCAQELASLSEAADTLVYLAPGSDPPVGFETRTLERIRSSAPMRRLPRRRAWTLAAAGCVALAFGLGWVTHVSAKAAPRPSLAAGYVVQRGLSEGNLSVGEAYVYTGHPTWMLISVALPGDPNAVRCTVLTIDGRRHDLGKYALAAGSGDWAAPLPVPLNDIRDIQLATTSGDVVARLSSTPWSGYATPSGSSSTEAPQSQ